MSERAMNEGAMASGSTTAPPQSVVIEDRTVGAGAPCFIIAEIGVNHNGDMALAHRMIDAIADAGADCVKFQTFRAEEFCNNRDEVYEYLSQGRLVRESMFDMFKRLELRHDEHDALFAHVRERGLVPLSTPADALAVALLGRLDAGAYKIGSDDLVFSGFLELVARQGKPMILSTGMADAGEVARAIDVIVAAGNEQLILLHCVSEYPTPDAAVNLRKIEGLRAMTGRPVGFSDHSRGVSAALGAVAVGACVIEKHFTMDRTLPGPDHHFSCDPAELAELVRAARRLEAQLGSDEITPTSAERDMRKLARRSIVAAHDMPAGATITEADLAYRRPGHGLMPYEADRLTGHCLRRSVSAGHAFTIDDVT